MHSQVRDLGPSDLTAAIAGLASMRSRLAEGAPSASPAWLPPDLPASLMSEGSRLLTRSIARQHLSATEVVDVVWAFAMEGVFPRNLFDAAGRLVFISSVLCWQRLIRQRLIILLMTLSTITL